MLKKLFVKKEKLSPLIYNLLTIKTTKKQLDKERNVILFSFGFYDCFFDSFSNGCMVHAQKERQETKLLLIRRNGDKQMFIIREKNEGEEKITKPLKN